MKSYRYLTIFVLLLIALFQPWSYSYKGFDETEIDIAGGVVKFELTDQSRAKIKNAYCLHSTFRTKDKPGEPIAILIEGIGTKTIPDLGARNTDSGNTKGFDNSGNGPSFFVSPGISKLVFPTDEPLDVIGSIQYKGVSYPFHITLKLRYWEKNREVIRFCV